MVGGCCGGCSLKGGKLVGHAGLESRDHLNSHLRVCLATYADISFRQQFTSVWTCPDLCESARSRHALDLRAGANRWSGEAQAEAFCDRISRLDYVRIVVVSGRGGDFWTLFGTV